MDAEVAAQFLADWAIGGARAAPSKRQQAPAEAPATGSEAEGLLPTAAVTALASHGGANSDANTAPGGSAVERVAACAVSLAFLSDFYVRCVAPLERDGAPLSTKDVVERLVKPATQANAARNFASLVPGAVRRPTAFASHAFGNPFRLLVSALEEHFMNAVAGDVYVWVDVFAINQHDPGTDLHGGDALARTIELVGETLVVLDRAAYPLTRLWCLYEMGSTPPDKLRLLTPGFREAELASAFRAVNVDAAECFDSCDKARIREHIVAKYDSLAAFQQMLRLRLLLKPTSYEADRKALLTHNTDTWRFDELHGFASGAGDESRLACIAGGYGEGKSTLAAGLCEPNLKLVDAHHFCKASDVRRQDVGEIIRSLAYQLALRFPPFAGALLALQQADAESLSDPARSWELLLKRPLCLPQLRGTRVVLLFDALDEAGDCNSNISKVLSLMLDLGRIADGAAVSVIVTTRPEAGILAPMRSRWRDNVREFPPASLREGDQQSKLLALLRSQPPCTAFASVDAAYAAVFDAAAADTGTQRLLPILMAAQQPPSMALLEALGVRSACAALPGWGLLFEERDHCVHVLHKSLSEWLLDRSRSRNHVVDVAAGHRAWSELLSTQLRPWLESGAPAPPPGSYAYAHALLHLDRAGRGAEAKATLLRLPWLQATLRERGLYALLGDLASRMIIGDGTLALLHRTLRLSAPVLQGSDAAEALPGQLVGRLGGLLDTVAPEVARLYEAAWSWRGALAWLRPNKATLLAPVGALELRLEGHTDRVSTLVALAGGRVVSGSGDSTLRVWNAVTGECERTLDGHTHTVNALVALADGRMVSASGDKTLRVWNAATGECEHTLEGHTDVVISLVKLADGRVVSGSYDKTMRVWNAATGECKHTLEGHTDTVSTLLAADGRVVSGSDDKTLRVWNADTGKYERMLEGHTDLVMSLLALDDGRVVSGSYDNTLRMWNVATGLCLRTLEGHANGVTSLVALADGRVMSGSYDSTLRVWNVATGECLRTLEGHTGSVALLLLLGDGRVVSGSGDKTLRVWKAATGECDRTLEGHTSLVTSLVDLADGRMVSGSYDSTLRVWNAATDERERSLDGHTGWVSTLVALADGRVVSASDENALRVWNSVTGECERTLKGHTRGVNALLALAGGRMVSGSRDRTLRLWNAATGECEHTLEGHTDTVSKLVALADGRVVSGSGDSTLRVWNSVTGECERTLQGHINAVTSLLALADGRMVSGSGDKTLRVWNAATGECDRTLEGHTGIVMSLLELADGRLVSGSYDSTLRVWNVARGLCLRTLEGHANGVTSLVALADGRVMSGSDDKTLRVWNAATGECEQVAPQRSAAAAALQSLPRLQLRSSGWTLGAAPTVVERGSSVVGLGVAASYLDAAVTNLLAVPCCTDATSRDEVIVASTKAGVVHFFTLRAACC